ncbi:hypothetical protein [Aerosakkonema funiforme]
MFCHKIVSGSVLVWLTKKICLVWGECDRQFLRLNSRPLGAID